MVHRTSIVMIKKSEWDGSLAADLGVVGVAGLGASADLLGPHPVTLH